MTSIATSTSAQVRRQFHHVDARGLVVGRLAAGLSTILQGKHKPTYEPWADSGDHVVVTNASRVVFTGRKWYQKVYRHHTGWMGGLKEIPVQRVLERRPHELVEHAVFGMLPRNRSRGVRMKRLHVFGEEHIPLEYLRQLAKYRGELPPHVLRDLEHEALWLDEVYDPKVHKGWTLEVEEHEDSYEFSENASEGTRKARKRAVKPPRMFKPEKVHSHMWTREEWDELTAQGLSPVEIKERLEREVDPREFRETRRWLT